MATKKHIVDLDADPFIPDFALLRALGYKRSVWSVHQHCRGGKFVWDPRQVALYRSVNQQHPKTVPGRQPRRELKDQSVFNANLLDFLLAHKRLIPPDWKNKLVCFWGTLYREAGGRVLVRCLCWSQEFGWNSTCQQVNFEPFRHYSPAAVRINP